MKVDCGHSTEMPSCSSDVLYDRKVQPAYSDCGIVENVSLNEVRIIFGITKLPPPEDVTVSHQSKAPCNKASYSIGSVEVANISFV